MGIATIKFKKSTSKTNLKKCSLPLSMSTLSLSGFKICYLANKKIAEGSLSKRKARKGDNLNLF